MTSGDISQLQLICKHVSSAVLRKCMQSRSDTACAEQKLSARPVGRALRRTIVLHVTLGLSHLAPCQPQSCVSKSAMQCKTWSPHKSGVHANLLDIKEELFLARPSFLQHDDAAALCTSIPHSQSMIMTCQRHDSLVRNSRQRAMMDTRHYHKWVTQTSNVLNDRPLIQKHTYRAVLCMQAAFDILDFTCLLVTLGSALAARRLALTEHFSRTLLRHIYMALRCLLRQYQNLRLTSQHIRCASTAPSIYDRM